MIKFSIILLLFIFFKVTRSFLLLVQKKRTKENTPAAHLPLKIALVFGRAARHLLRRFCGAALFPKNVPDFLYAPAVRPESYLQHRFARCGFAWYELATSLRSLRLLGTLWQVSAEGTPPLCLLRTYGTLSLPSIHITSHWYGWLPYMMPTAPLLHVTAHPYMPTASSFNFIIF